MPPKNIQLLINPAAGSRRVNRVISAATLHFPAPAWKLHIKVLASPEEAYVLSRQARRRRYFAVLVSGGDGTLNEVGRALAGGQTALGIVPGGTGNGFARSMGIPLSPDKACAMLARAKPRRTDIGFLDEDRAFLNVCGFGYDAFAAGQANRLRWIGRISGLLRYISAGLIALFKFKPQRFEIKADGFRHEGPALLLCVANAEQYGFGAVIVPGALPFDGRLDGVIVPPLPVPLFLAACVQTLRGKRIKGAHYFSGKKIEIRLSAPGEAPLHLDGESAGFAPATIKVKRGALRVLLP